MRYNAIGIVFAREGLFYPLRCTGSVLVHALNIESTTLQYNNSTLQPNPVAAAIRCREYCKECSEKIGVTEFAVASDECADIEAGRDCYSLSQIS